MEPDNPAAETDGLLTDEIEWLEPDGLGGFASGTATGRRTRRYHALLLTATSPPTGRFVLVNGFDAWVETAAGRFAVSSQRYAPQVIFPDERSRLISFDAEPWPTWRWHLEAGQELTLELFVPHEISACVLSWRLKNDASPARLFVRPFLSGRDYHSLHRENPAFRFEPRVQADSVTWKPYDSVPSTTALTNGEYRHDPDWFRNFLYVKEQERGLDSLEDLGSPGVFSWELPGKAGGGGAVLLFAAEGDAALLRQRGEAAAGIASRLREAETRRRAAFSTLLARSADAYVVRGRRGRTIIAGYPWFTDWGRDTFISLRGLCLANGFVDEAGEILAAWVPTVSQGMLPNRFPDQGQAAEYNSVDSSLWYVIAVHDYLETAQRLGRSVPTNVIPLLRDTVLQVLNGYYRGTRYGIRCDEDGLLAAGAPGTQLTWMDARVGDRAITPRIGKPVEIQALWLCALKVGSRFDKQWLEVHERGRNAFSARFWNESLGCLYDVVDVDHQKGAVDASLRPNQILAVGGLPWMLLEPEQARRVVQVVESRLWTPMGPRTLDPADPNYVSKNVGGVAERDAAYHQGPAWPWLAGPFVEAWLRVHGQTAESCREAEARFLAPLFTYLKTAGCGHVPELADGDPPHAWRGCPFQAWSLAELIRARQLVAPPPAP